MTRSDPHRSICTQQGLVTFRLEPDGLHLLDQRALPLEEKWLVLTTLEEVAEAIETLAVRGAPAIGGAAALAMAHLARTDSGDDVSGLLDRLRAAKERLARTRPTAVNLFYALDRIGRVLDKGHADARTLAGAVVDEAEAICTEDAAACAAMGQHGAERFADGDVVLTICHTGTLATCGIGTALGVLRTANEQGKHLRVLALETRPLLQGARLTAWECDRLGLDVTLLCDSMAAFALARQGVTRAIAGADRIAANGDVANKIGTLALATLCRSFGVPFYVAAPSTTFDVTLASGAQIPIEERAPDEVRAPRGTRFAPDVPVWNPAFDVTPAALISGIITENGVWDPPYSEAARDALLG